MRVVLFLISATLVSIAALAGQDTAANDFERRELRIPVRDGAKLYAIALIPESMTKPLPIILIRTPYGAARSTANGLRVGYRELAKDGYIFVTQDSRGRHNSEGQFVMNGALHDPRVGDGVDEATDTYDTIEWLVNNISNHNGRVGVLGVSYPGWLAGIAGVNPHPALRAISPQAPMADTWLGDDLFHQGAFREAFAFGYVSGMELTNNNSKRVAMNRYDQYDWYLQFDTLEELAKVDEVMNLPSWKAAVEHPAYDEYWKAKAMQRVLTTPDVAVLTVGGFWDQEDKFGPQEAYRVLEQNDADDVNHIVLGPWNHGGWSRPGGDSLGPIQFGAKTSDYYREYIQRPWFAYWLRGEGEDVFPEAWVFASGENEWHTFESWPPEQAEPAKLYLRNGGLVSFDAPTGEGFDSYISDPEHPVPYMARPVVRTRWQQWLVEDQRFADNRPDVLTWQTGPLSEDVTIAGNIVAELFASTTGADADWVVKLIDVYPDTVEDDPTMGGHQLMVATDIMRGRYRNSFSKPERIPPNTVVSFSVDLHQQLYRFGRGHRIMVQVQSTWFPLYDRNPQKYVENIFHAQASDFEAQEHRVYRTPTFPSHIAVSILP